jgi:acyl-CoA dehydrogenase family protein 9
MNDLPFERFLRDTRIMRIFEGTNEVLRVFIALAGMERLGEYLEGVGRALREPIQEIGVLTDFAFHRIQDALGARRSEARVAEPLAGCLRQVERFTGILHDSAESLIRKHRDRLVEEQFQLERLADVAIDVFALVAAIGRAQARIERDGEAVARPEIDLVRQLCRDAGARVERNQALLSANHDPRLRRIASEAIAVRRGARG